MKYNEIQAILARFHDFETKLKDYAVLTFGYRVTTVLNSDIWYGMKPGNQITFIIWNNPDVKQNCYIRTNDDFKMNCSIRFKIGLEDDINLINIFKIATWISEYEF